MEQCSCNIICITSHIARLIVKIAHHIMLHANIAVIYAYNIIWCLIVIWKLTRFVRSISHCNAHRRLNEKIHRIGGVRAQDKKKEILPPFIQWLSNDFNPTAQSTSAPLSLVSLFIPLSLTVSTIMYSLLNSIFWIRGNKHTHTHRHTPKLVQFSLIGTFGKTICKKNIGDRNVCWT